MKRIGSKTKLGLVAIYLLMAGVLTVFAAGATDSLRGDPVGDSGDPIGGVQTRR